MPHTLGRLLIAGALSTFAVGSHANPSIKDCRGLDSASERRACEQIGVVAYLEDRVRYRLKDPESARFREDRIYRSVASDDLAVCGMVNGKNGYGAYTGYSAFIATTRGDVLLLESEKVEVFAYAAKLWCRGWRPGNGRR